MSNRSILAPVIAKPRFKRVHGARRLSLSGESYNMNSRRATRRPDDATGMSIAPHQLGPSYEQYLLGRTACILYTTLHHVGLHDREILETHPETESRTRKCHRHHGRPARHPNRRPIPACLGVYRAACTTRRYQERRICRVVQLASNRRQNNRSGCVGSMVISTPEPAARRCTLTLGTG